MTTLAAVALALSFHSEQEASIDLRHLQPSDDDTTKRAELLLLTHVVLRQMATLRKRKDPYGVYKTVIHVMEALPALSRGEDPRGTKLVERTFDGKKRIAAELIIRPNGECDVSYKDTGFGLFDSRLDHYATSAVFSLVRHLLSRRPSDRWYRVAVEWALNGCAKVAQVPDTYLTSKSQYVSAAGILVEAVETADRQVRRS